jgi:peptidoglycan-associated lipoprotein
MRIFRLVLIAVSVLAIAGCKSKPPVIPEGSAPPAETGTSTEATGPGTGVGSGGEAAAEERARREAEAAGTVVYFDYDRAEIKPEFVGVIAASAKYLNGVQTRKVRLEGHSDERGSREYNIGLGERRAQSVRRALMLQGVRENQITTVSYGEERPAVQGSDEAAYAKNRRVQLSYGR